MASYNGCNGFIWHSFLPLPMIRPAKQLTFKRRRKRKNMLSFLFQNMEKSHDSSPGHSKRSSSKGTHISSRVVTTYSYRSLIVSNVEWRSIHLVLHKFFNFRFLVSPFPKMSITISKKRCLFGELSKKTVQFRAAVHHVLYRSYFASMTNCKIQCMQAASLIVSVGCTFGDFGLNTSFAWTHGWCRVISLTSAISYINFMLFQAFCECRGYGVPSSPSEVTQVDEHFTLHWAAWILDKIQKSKAHWQNFSHGMSSHQELKKNGDTSQDIDKSSHELSWLLLLLLRFGWSYLYSGHSLGHGQGDPWDQGYF